MSSSSVTLTRGLTCTLWVLGFGPSHRDWAAVSSVPHPTGAAALLACNQVIRAEGLHSQRL
jgi:hypothetical protein